MATKDGHNTERSEGRGAEWTGIGAFAVGAGIVLAVMFGVNAALYGDPLGPYLKQLLSLGLRNAAVNAGAANRSSFATAAAGSLLAPNAGLFVFAPSLLLVLGGLGAAWRQGFWGRWALAVVGVHWLLIARNPLWWGGWCWGGRLFADLAPLLLLLGLPAALSMVERGRSWLLIALIALSMFVQAIGVYNYRYSWHLTGPNIESDALRLWDMRDWIVREALLGRRPALRVEAPWPTIDRVVELKDEPASPARLHLASAAWADAPGEAYAAHSSGILYASGPPAKLVLQRGTEAWLPLPAPVNERVGTEYYRIALPDELADAHCELATAGRARQPMWSMHLGDLFATSIGRASMAADLGFEVARLLAPPPALLDGRAWLVLRLPEPPLVRALDVLPEIVAVRPPVVVQLVRPAPVAVAPEETP